MGDSKNENTSFTEYYTQMFRLLTPQKRTARHTEHITTDIDIEVQVDITITTEKKWQTRLRDNARLP